MRYYGGGIGHLNDTPPKHEMDVQDDEEDDTARPDGPQDVVMNHGEMEAAENDEEDVSPDDDNEDDDDDNYDYEGLDEGGDEDEDEDEEARGSDNNEADDYGYASA